MAEYISKEDLIKAIEDAGADVIADYGDYDCESGFSRDNLSQIINSIPVADVAPVRHGRWAHLGGDEWCCTNCGNVISTEGSWEQPYQKYCPSCGAKMDLED